MAGCISKGPTSKRVALQDLPPGLQSFNDQCLRQQTQALNGPRNIEKIKEIVREAKRPGRLSSNGLVDDLDEGIDDLPDARLDDFMDRTSAAQDAQHQFYQQHHPHSNMPPPH